jgi:hypothetical protein
MTTTLVDRRNGIAEGLAIKAPCRAATTANITLSGLQTIAGIVLAAGDRVLVTDQTNAVDNGIYDVATGAWDRAHDFDGVRDVVSGTRVLARTVGAYHEFILVTADPIVVGTTSLSFARLLEEEAFALSTDINLSTVSATVNSIRTTGRAAVGDGGAALWRRSATNPGHPGVRQSVDGAYWVIAEALVYVDMLTSASDAAATAFAIGSPLFIDSGIATVTINPTTQAAADTDVARHAVIQNAVDWRTSCITRNNADIVISIAGTGPHRVFGQIFLGSFTDGLNANSLNIAMPAMTASNTISTATAITVGSKLAFVTRVSVTAGGTGFTTAPTVVFTGGGGSGATATAYVAGGIVVAVVMGSFGTNYTSAPTVSFTGGGGSGATATAYVNLNVYPVTMTMTNALPASVAVGQPVGIINHNGTNDCAGINGAAILTGFSSLNKTISFYWTAPFAGTLTGGTPSAGFVIFPTTWLEVTGGYTGEAGGKEGYFSFNGGTQFRANYLSMRWVDGDAQQDKFNPTGLFGQIAGPSIHIGNYSIVAGFPQSGFRLNHGQGWLNRLCLGGSIYGLENIRAQHGAEIQVNGGSSGSVTGPSLYAGTGGNIRAASHCMGGFATGLDGHDGGEIDFRVGKLACGSVGALISDNGRIQLESDAEIDRCGVALSWNSGGKIIGNLVPTNSLTSDTINSIPKDTPSRGSGGWFSVTPPSDIDGVLNAPSVAFTPALKFGGANVSMTGTFTGKHFRVGPLLVVLINITLTNKGPSVGNATITGLPTASTGTAILAMAGNGITLNVAGGYTNFAAQVGDTSASVSLLEEGNNVGLAALTEADFVDTSIIRITGIYFVG